MLFEVSKGAVGLEIQSTDPDNREYGRVVPPAKLYSNLSRMTKTDHITSDLSHPPPESRSVSDSVWWQGGRHYLFWSGATKT
jgi:hypothetical protein